VNDLWPKVSDQFVALLEMETSDSQHKSTAIKTLIAAMKTLHDDNFRHRNGSFEGVLLTYINTVVLLLYIYHV